MDDLKKYLKEVSKYSFWIITVLVLILSSAIFYMTKSSLDDAIATRISTLETSFRKISDVSSKAATHPNEHSHKEMDRRLDGLMNDVDRAWAFQYDRQKEFLTWPTEAFFKPETHEIFDNLRPFEKKVPFPLPAKVPPPLDAITENDRKVYRSYIEPEFPSLARRIGSTWKYALDSKNSATGGGGLMPPGGGGGSMPPSGFGGLGGLMPPGSAAGMPSDDSRDLVRWSEDSQKQLIDAVLPWFTQPAPPTIHEIYYAQEDIWILRGLMDIIAQTNSGANENFQAIVKEIEWIRMGARASRNAGSLWQSGAASPMGGGLMGGGPPSSMGGGGPPAGYSGGGGGGMGGMGGMPPGYGSGGGKGGLAPSGNTVARLDPADSRYVDTNFKPLTGAQLRSAMNLQNATDAVNAVAKRIPVRMRLKVDERFGRLITECGNGKMTLEVVQVRYNTDPAEDAAAAGSGGLMGGAGGGKPSAGGTGGAGAGMGLAGTEPPAGGFSQAAAKGSGEVTIEIFGLIYLFNPPASLSATNAAVTTPTAPVTAGPEAAPVAPSGQTIPSDQTVPPAVASSPQGAAAGAPQGGADAGTPAADGAVPPPAEPTVPPTDPAVPPTDPAVPEPEAGGAGTDPSTEGSQPGEAGPSENPPADGTGSEGG
jgi:hypothetical protein